MSRRLRLWWPMLLKSKTIKTKKSLTPALQCLPLEDRVVPDNNPFTGPVLDGQIQEIARLGLNAYTPLASIPPSVNGAQSYFVLAKSNAFRISADEIAARLPTGTATTILAIPRPDGGFERFKVWETQLLTPEFAAARPDVHTYRGIGLDDPNAVLAADLTPVGFRTQVLSPNGTYYIDPYYHLDNSVFVSYFNHDNLKDPGGCDGPYCEGVVAPSGAGPQGMGGGATPLGPSPPISLGTNLRTFRTAVAATGEYTTFQGGTVGAAQNAMITTINRVSGVYEKELGVKLNLILNTSIIYTNATTDPYTNGSPGSMINENQTNITNVIGSANYDIGHVFGTNSGGLAGLGVVGNSSNKARGVTGSGSPTGDNFDIDYVAHEMGHQFGGNHSFNGVNGSAAGNRNSATAWEPGSGSTIMSYAGICGVDDLQAHSDAVFHVGSIGEIRNYLNTIPSVGTTTASGNTVPTVSAGPDYTIPANTPFALTGSASDANGDPITYNWEQYDAVNGSSGTALGVYPTTNQVLFRSFPSVSTPTRTFPKLSSLLSNTSTTAELMPTTSRPLNFTLTARDTRAMVGPTGGVIGGIASDDMLVTVINTGAAFTVTSPNTAVSWQGGSSQAVTWNVAGTTANGINAANVNILLSTDGGNTFPITVLANTPNDGSESVVVPNNPGSQARIKVVPTNNIFFDISNVNFTITPGSAMQVSSTTPANGGILSTAVPGVYTLDLNFSLPVDAASLSASDLSVSTGTVTGATVPAGLPNTARFTINAQAEGPLNASLAAGAVTSITAIGTSAFFGSYAVDIATAPFGAAFTAASPLGSGVYSATLSNPQVNIAGDTDTFTIDLDGGQTISALVLPGAGLMPKLTITGPDTNLVSSATAAGKTASLASTPVSAGTYSFTIEGISGTTGSYSLQLLLNAAPEAESVAGTANNSTATAQNLDPSFLSLGGGGSLSSVFGRFDGGNSSAEIEPNETFSAATNVAASFGSYSGNLYHLGLSGTVSASGDLDYYNIGALQVGDIITITETGSPSRSANTLPDPLVSLYRGASTLVIDGSAAQYDDGGVGFDSLIYRYTVAAADTYYIRAGAYNTNTGTYTVGVYLENTGAVPTTSGSIFTETESNNTQATANNVSGSWRASQYVATATGSIATATDVDTFAYSFAAGDTVSINARSTSGLKTKVRLLNSAGTAIALEDGTSANTSTSPGNDSPLYAFRIPSAGTYYVDVQSFSGTGSYALDVYLSSTTAPPSSADYYALTLAAGQTVSMALEGQTAGTYALDLVNAANTVLANSVASATNVDRAIASYTAPSAGVYYARISGSTSADYVLTTAINTTFDLESNDTFGVSQSLAANTRATGGLVNGNDDWYSVDLTAGFTYTFATSTPGDGSGLFDNTLDPRIEVYTPGNVLLASNTNGAADGRNAVVSVPITVSGTYRIRLAVESGSGGEYTMSISSQLSQSVTGFVVNNALTQRSRLTSITVQFANPVTPADFNSAGAMTLTRYASTISGVNGTIVQTGAAGANGLISLAQGAANELVLTFSNADSSTMTQGVEFGSLADGRWRLAIPALGYQNPLGGSDPIIRRLFGDVDNSGLVDATDFGFFPPLGAITDNPFDFNANSDIDSATDFTEFGNRFGVTL